MTNEEYIAQISKEPTLDMTSEIKNEDGSLRYKYIKKSILQSELLRVYNGHVRWEMLRENVTAHTMFGVGRLEYMHPITSIWLSVTGTASLPQDKKMRLGFPALESHCFINAAKKIGIWFGQRLNIEVEDKMPEEVGVTDVPELTPEQEADEIFKSIKSASSVEELKSWRMPVYRKGQNPDLASAYEQRMRELLKK